MPDQKRSRTKGIPHHPLVEALAPDPNQPPRKATRLFGYPGAAADPKSTRLWLDEELTSYLDVPDDAILYYRTLDNEEGTILWVDPTATLTHSAPQAQEVQADFLSGPIAQRSLAPALANIPQFGANNTILQLGPSIAIICPTYAATLCESRNYPCTRPWICNRPVSLVCESVARPCITRKIVNCPSPDFRCVQETVHTQLGCPPETLSCPIETFETPATPVLNQVGPFRPQQ
jgi:hypothetical protein